VIKLTGMLMAGLACGYAAANLFGTVAVDNFGGDERRFETAAAIAVELDDRLLVLENALADETEKRLQLESLVREFLDSQDATLTGNAEGPVAIPPVAERMAFARARSADRNLPERRRQRLEEAGFSPDRADWILQRESELRLESLYEEWEQRRARVVNGDVPGVRFSPLRSELSDAEYENYLAANGQPTSIRVNQLFEQSPAQFAGLREGDEIVRYNGERVYNIYELNNATVQGAAGEAVTIEVLRDGVSTQMALPRGPLGIQGGFEGRRR